MPRYNPNTGELTEYQVGPFDSAHIYLQWGGKLPGNEQWSNGLRFAGPSATADADAAAMLVGAAAAVVAYHQRAGTGTSPRAKLSFVKCNGIDVDGHYISLGTNQALYADLAGGGLDANTPANQVANVVSLTTGFSRGPAHRGRIYLPLPTYALDTAGVYSAANADQVSISTDTFIAALNAVNAAWDVAIFSRKAGAPMHRVVTGNVVGRVYDTQRRRRRALVENYQ